MKTSGVPGLPRWITPNGEIDLERLPLDGIFKQAIDPEFERFRSACVLLGSIARSGRSEAGVYLLGLFAYYASDLRRLEAIAEQLAHFRHQSAADALFAEIRRVKSSNTTRRYLDRVLRSLAALPGSLVNTGLEALAQDTSFSSTMRAKLWSVRERTNTGFGDQGLDLRAVGLELADSEV
jgi:hypothetical protein